MKQRYISEAVMEYGAYMVNQHVVMPFFDFTSLKLVDYYVRSARSWYSSFVTHLELFCVKLEPNLNRPISNKPEPNPYK